MVDLPQPTKPPQLRSLRKDCAAELLEIEAKWLEDKVGESQQGKKTTNGDQSFCTCLFNVPLSSFYLRYL